MGDRQDAINPVHDRVQEQLDYFRSELGKSSIPTRARLTELVQEQQHVRQQLTEIRTGQVSLDTKMERLVHLQEVSLNAKTIRDPVRKAAFIRDHLREYVNYYTAKKEMVSDAASIDGTLAPPHLRSGGGTA